MSTTQPLSPRTALSDLAQRQPGALRVFQRHHLDISCCSGRRSLAEACEAAGLDVTALIVELGSAVDERHEPVGHRGQRSREVLTDHIHLDNPVPALARGSAGSGDHEGESRDLYAEAIPAEDLAALARAHRAECAAGDDASIRRCAEEIVRARTCYCASSQSTIVDALVVEFMSTVAAEGGSGAPR